MLSRIIKALYGKIKHHLWVMPVIPRPLKDLWAKCLYMKNIVVGICSAFLIVFIVCTIAYYNVSRQSGDVFYKQTLKKNSPLIAYGLIKAMPNLISALGELLTQVDRYGAFNENQFSPALDTQLRRNLMLRFAYLRLRIRYWYMFSKERQQRAVWLDYNPYKSRYSFFS